jgi:hypothetical protein
MTDEVLMEEHWKMEVMKLFQVMDILPTLCLLNFD